MKKIILTLLAGVALSAGLASCSGDEITDDTAFPTTAPAGSELDNWLLNNFTYPYNTEITYKLNDIETDMAYHVVPAETAKAAKLAKLVKYMWFDAYDEVAGQTFLKKYAPRMIMLVGSGQYSSNNTVILGYASGSIKIALLNVNELTDDKLRDIEKMNEWYLSTLHHEFTHILNQKIAYDRAFDQISAGDYVSGSWYQHDNSEAYSKGFVRNYAMQEPNEDFAETCADYIVYSDAKWADIKRQAGANYSKIEEKVAFIRAYLESAYGINIDKMREVVQRRASELKYLDLDHLN